MRQPTSESTLPASVLIEAPITGQTRITSDAADSWSARLTLTLPSYRIAQCTRYRSDGVAFTRNAATAHLPGLIIACITTKWRQQTISQWYHSHQLNSRTFIRNTQLFGTESSCLDRQKRKKRLNEMIWVYLPVKNWKKEYFHSGWCYCAHYWYEDVHRKVVQTEMNTQTSQWILLTINSPSLNQLDLKISTTQTAYFENSGLPKHTNT